MKSTVIVCLFGVFCGVVGLILREINPKFSAVFSLATGVVFFLIAWKYLSPVAEYALAVGEEEAPGVFKTIFKALGMAVLVSMTADLCRDMDEKKAAEKVELCGKAALAFLALPLIKEILDRLRALL